MIFAIDIPNPIDVLGGAIGTATGWAWDKVTAGITNWVLGAVGYFVDGVVGFLLTSARPDVESAWFAGAGSPYATVRNIAGITMAMFVFLGLIQGLLAGDVGGMIRRIAVDLPLAVLGMIATTVVVGRLLELTDALSTAVLSNSDGQGVHFLSGFAVVTSGAPQGFAAVLLGLVAVIAAFFVWVELMVRSVLVYLLVAVSPLSFAAMVWPSARGVLRRTVELLAAVILSKLVISIAIAVGVAALSGAGSAGRQQPGVIDQGATSLGTLLVGTAILGMAAFAPFLVLKLIPVVEAGVVAHGVSRAPVRAAQAAMSNAYYLSSVRRLAGGNSSGSGSTGSSNSKPASGTGSATSGAKSSRLAGSASSTATTTSAASAATPATAAATVATTAVKQTAKTANGAVDTATSKPGTGGSSPSGQPPSSPRRSPKDPRGGSR